MGNQGSSEDGYKLATLQNTQNAIEFVKKQQWIVTNYGLLLFGVIFGYLKLLGFPEQQISCPEKCVIFIFAFIIYILCVVVLRVLHNSWNNYDDLFNKIEETYEKTEFYKDIIKPHKCKNQSRGHRGHILIYRSLIFILTIGVLAIARFIFWN